MSYQAPTADDLKRGPAHFYAQHPELASRRPGNWRIAAVLATFAVGSYFYTMAAVRQDEFKDFDDKGNLITDATPVTPARTTQ